MLILLGCPHISYYLSLIYSLLRLLLNLITANAGTQTDNASYLKNKITQILFNLHLLIIFSKENHILFDFSSF
jgi:hypothetical protein